MLNVINNTSENKAANGTGLFSATHVAEERRSRSWLDARIHDGKRRQFTEEHPVSITPVLAEVMLGGISATGPCAILLSRNIAARSVMGVGR